jgi:hypothetical protein
VRHPGNFFDFVVPAWLCYNQCCESKLQVMDLALAQG